MRFPVFVFLLCILARANGQIPLSLEFEKAVANQTRSLTGAPGPKYFQNRSDYRIRATVHPKSSLLAGEETVTYYNNSPTPLPTLVIRLYQDILKRGFRTDERIDPADQGKGVELRWVVVDGETVNIPGAQATRKGTNLFLTLKEPLPPGKSVVLDIGWQFRLPRKTRNRMGVYSDTAIFVAYWYPQVSVYDDIDGWDQLDYTGRVEFYNDFGDFEVEITVPDRYLVWATGEWKNPEQCLAPHILERFLRAAVADTVLPVVSSADYLTKARPTLSHDRLTYAYSAQYVPDFAFCMSDYYLWDATSAVVDPQGRRVRAEAVYSPKAADFPDVAGYAKEVLEYMSAELPGVPYPYPKMTIFQGEMSGGGMEYPMMVNNAASPSQSASFSLTYHEIAHTYFPFLMGIHEKKYAWMDEGWASFFPEDKMLAKGYSRTPLQWEAIGYGRVSGSANDAPLMSFSHQLKPNLYYTLSYSKASLAYHMLREALGAEKFKAALQAYMANWSGKHPTPYDFFHSFNTAAGEDLSWFWNPWFFEARRADLSIASVTLKGRTAEVVIANASGLPLPVRLEARFKNGETEFFAASPAIWKDNPQAFTLTLPARSKKFSLILGEDWIPDHQPANNTFSR